MTATSKRRLLGEDDEDRLSIHSSSPRDECACRDPASSSPLQRLVQGKRWMSDHMFLELFALGGSLPGPTSTEVSFALGAVKQGVFGERGRDTP